MLGKANRTGSAQGADDGETNASELELELEWSTMTGHSAVDNELQAAIEYKIALAGMRGAEKVLELLNTALLRLSRE